MAVQDTSPLTGTGYPASHYKVGQHVWIKKYGCAYQATVVKVGRTTLTVNFQPKTARARDFTFPGRDVEHYVRPIEDIASTRGLR